MRLRKRTLCKVRQQRSLSLTDLAHKSTIARSTIHRIEKGQSPHPQTRRLLAQALMISVQSIDWPE